jgi:FlaA1/EpsC-like NDP-sugar epimerase
LKDNLFFKPTPLYKEFLILDLIEKNKDITQREMASNLGVALSMVNNYLDEYEKKGYIQRKYISSKVVEYHITKSGIERKKVMNIWYLKSSQSIYLSAKDNISSFLKQIIDKGFKKILLYGAGEVAEIIIQVLNDDKQIPLKVVALVDDDKTKEGSKILNCLVINKNQIGQYEHDGILVSSYTHQQAIYTKLVGMKYDKSKIIQFFD